MSSYNRPYPPSLDLARGQKVYDVDVSADSDDSDQSDDYFSDEFKCENYPEDSFPSDSESSDQQRPLPVRYYERYGSSHGRERRRDDGGTRRPACGVPMQSRLRSARNDSNAIAPFFPRNTHTYSAISSSTNEEDETATTNEDDVNPMCEYSVVRKAPKQLPPPLYPRRDRGRNELPKIPELSPIHPVNRDRSPQLNMPPPISNDFNFQPKRTSSVINAPSFPNLPKTNPHRQHYGTYSRPPRTLHMHNYKDVIRSSDMQYNRCVTPLSSESSLFDTTSPIRDTNPKSRRIRPEKYQLPGQVAKARGIEGIVFLTISMAQGQLRIHVREAAYFRSEHQIPRTTHVEVKLIHFERERYATNRKRIASRTRHATNKTYRTKTIPSDDEPNFNEEFVFKLGPENDHDLITLTVYEHEWHEELNQKRLTGCLTFHASKLRRMARNVFYDDFEHFTAVEIANDGYFLLHPRYGERTNMPQRKISHVTIYPIDGVSGCASTSSSSLNAHSPHKMLRSTDYSSCLLPSRSSSAIPSTQGGSKMTGGCNLINSRPSYEERRPIKRDLYDCTTESSSTNSTEYDLYRHRMTLPSITTTNSELLSEDGRPSCHAYDPCRLHVDGHSPSGSGDDKKKRESGVRRAASFTYSPTGSLGKHNRRPAAIVGKEQEEAAKKKLFGPLSKTFSYLRSKVDQAMSTSSLFPSKEEVRQWETSFESLLNHKYGQMLFTQFLEKEFSKENIEFWLQCEELKKMKEGKKSTVQKAHEIYKEFVANGAPKEVNLDSDTRAATKAALENASRTDTFSLAQSRIEQLMAKDSYTRFLKDKLFLDMLNASGRNDGEEGDHE